MSHASARKRRQRTQRSPWHRLHVDCLEQRLLLAADLNFNPLQMSDVVVAPNVGENTPFALPSGFTQTLIENRTTDPDLGDELGESTLNETGPSAGRYLFVTNGTPEGGLARIDLFTGETVNLLDIASPGDFPGEPLEGFLELQNLEAATWTPWGTLLVAENIAGTDVDFIPDAGALGQHGHVYEIIDPTGSNPLVFARSQLGSTRHEALTIDAQNNVYMIDGISGAILRFTPDGFGIDSPLESGTLAALNAPSIEGPGNWQVIDTFLAEFSVPNALDFLDPVAEPVTQFNDPRDLDVGPSELGEVLYAAIAGDSRVLGIDLDGDFGDTETPFVYIFVSQDTFDRATADPPGGEASVGLDFSDPISLSVDALGRVYIGEGANPAPGAGSPGNDIWLATDVDGDGRTDQLDPLEVEDGSIGRVATLRTNGASPRGLYANPFNANDLYVSISGTTSNRDAVFLIHRNTPASEVGVTHIELDGETVLVVNGSDNSDRITISGEIFLKIVINNKVFSGFPSNRVIINAGGGNDKITVGGNVIFDFTINGGDGSDVIYSGLGYDTISGGAGNDRIFTGQGDNFAAGGDGNDSINGYTGFDELEGGAGNDRLHGHQGDDILRGGAGNDWLYGHFGNDLLIGDAGNDALHGYFGDDILDGGAGSDLVSGGTGHDVNIGGDGADRIFGGDGDDLLIGGILAFDNTFTVDDALFEFGVFEEDLITFGGTNIGDDDIRRAALLEFWQFISFDVDGRLATLRTSFENVGFSTNEDNDRDILDGNSGLDLYLLGNNDLPRNVGDGDQLDPDPDA